MKKYLTYGTYIFALVWLIILFTSPSGFAKVIAGFLLLIDIIIILLVLPLIEDE